MKRKIAISNDIMGTKLFLYILVNSYCLFSMTSPICFMLSSAHLFFVSAAPMLTTKSFRKRKYLQSLEKFTQPKTSPCYGFRSLKGDGTGIYRPFAS